MSETEKSILKTLACYEALGRYPLTAVEIYRYLQKENPAQPAPRFLEIFNLLAKNSTLNQRLENRHGFFFFKEAGDLYQKRIYRYKISITKWRKTKWLGVFLRLVPFLRGIAINGSLAVNNASAKSDIDFLIFTKKGRIWTCRLLLGFFLQILGQRRHGNVIADKICLNHYIAEPSCLIPVQNTPNAQLYCRLVPLLGYNSYQLFFDANASWLKDFIFFPPAERKKHQRQINEKSIIYLAAKYASRLMELILELAGAGAIEKILGRWQKKRIMAKISPRPVGQDELLLDASMLVFHYPICKNREAVRVYKERVKSL